MVFDFIKFLLMEMDGFLHSGKFSFISFSMGMSFIFSWIRIFCIRLVQRSNLVCHRISLRFFSSWTHSSLLHVSGSLPLSLPRSGYLDSVWHCSHISGSISILHAILWRIRSSSCSGSISHSASQGILAWSDMLQERFLDSSGGTSGRDSGKVRNISCRILSDLRLCELYSQGCRYMSSRCISRRWSCYENWGWRFSILRWLR